MSTNLNSTLPEVLTRGVAEVLPNRETLAKLMSEKKIRLYLGIDPTAPFLTLGHAVVLRKLQQFADLGHEVILLIGNGTVRIGDPTGRDNSRPVLTDEVIDANFKDWQKQASKILDFSKIKIMRNGDWLDKLTYAEIIKLMAQTTVQQLIERDMFQDRIKNQLPIFGHEIMYPLLQGYDSVALDVDLEIGGTDQTFNMMMGRHLQQQYNGREKWVLCTPIINGTDGRKMSKSLGNYVALTEPAPDMYGKLMRITDDMIVQFFTLLTDMETAEIETIRAAMEQGANPMEFKKKLALTITTMYHDAAAAEAAQAQFESLSQDRNIPTDLPSKNLVRGRYPIYQLATHLQLDMSRSEYSRLISQGAVQFDGNKITDPFAEIDIQAEHILKVGKRYFVKLIAE